jgi:hypothetical protein
MNSDDAAANNDKIMPDHVLEVSLEGVCLLVREIDEMIIENDKILEELEFEAVEWHCRCDLYMAYLEKL